MAMNVKAVSKTITDEINKKAFPQFNEWLKEPIPKQISKDIIFPGGEILVELFMYKHKGSGQSEKLVDLQGKSLVAKARSKIYPLAKVISVGLSTPESIKKFLRPGVVVTLRDDMTKEYENPAYEQYLESMKERPAPNWDSESIPSKVITKLVEYERYKYNVNKFVTESEKLLYLLPPMNIVSIYKDSDKE